MLIKIQRDATVCRYLFTAKSLYMFWVSQYPSSGVLKTVTAASGTGHNTGTATSLQRGLIRPNSMLIKIQRDATVYRYLFTAKTLYMFRVSQHPSSGVLKTLTATSGTGHNTVTATSLQRGLIRPNSMLIKIQRDATVCRYLFTAKSLYMFCVSQHPLSGVPKTVTAAYGTGHNTVTATSLQRQFRSGHVGGK